MNTKESAIYIEPGEKVVLEVRRHWFYLLGQILILVIIMFLPLFVFNFISSSGIWTLTNKEVGIFIFVSAWWMLLLWLVIFVGWTNYYLDVWVVTDRRILDIEQESLFVRHIAECRIANIEDMAVRINGIIPTALDFGNLEIQTAGEANEFHISQIPHPNRVRDVISSLNGRLNSQSEAGEKSQGDSV